MSNDLIDQLKDHIGEQGADINKLERQLFIAERAIAEQRRVIEMERSTVVDCWGKIEEQSSLINRLADCAKYYSNQNVTGWPMAAEEALAAYESWKGKCDVA